MDDFGAGEMIWYPWLEVMRLWDAGFTCVHVFIV
jgi:hypothetical protein